MGKKRKAYNPVKRINLLAKSVLKGHAVVFVGGNGGKCDLVDIKKAHIYQPRMEVARVIEQGRFKWAILCAAFCRGQDGQEYMKSQLVYSPEECRQSDLAGTVEGLHQSMIRNEINQQHLLNVGWLAAPVQGDIDEGVAGKIFAKAGAWEYLSKWENEGLGV